MKPTNNTPSGSVTKPEVIQPTQEQYLKALDKVWDALDRIAIKLCLLGSNARLAHKHKPFEGDVKLYLNKHDLNPRHIAHIKTYLGIEVDRDTQKKQTFVIDGVTFHFIVPQQNYAILRNTQQWIYPMFPELMYLPNPMNKLSAYKML